MNMPLPADVLEQQPIDDRREEITGRITRLEEAGDEAARLRWNRFHRQRGADAPFAAHGDAEQGAQDKKRRKVGRKARSEFERGKKQHVYHQDRPAPPTIGGTAEQVGSDRAHRQSQKDGEGDVGDVGSKFRGDIFEHEYQDEEIEGVERPAQKARRNYVFLLTGPARKRRNPHRATPIFKICYVARYKEGVASPISLSCEQNNNCEGEAVVPSFRGV
jgi:hypothetical protein